MGYMMNNSDSPRAVDCMGAIVGYTMADTILHVAIYAIVS